MFLPVCSGDSWYGVQIRQHFTVPLDLTSGSVFTTACELVSDDSVFRYIYKWFRSGEGWYKIVKFRYENGGYQNRHTRDMLNMREFSSTRSWASGTTYLEGYCGRTLILDHSFSYIHCLAVVAKIVLYLIRLFGSTVHVKGLIQRILTRVYYLQRLGTRWITTGRCSYDLDEHNTLSVNIVTTLHICS